MGKPVRPTEWFTIGLGENQCFAWAVSFHPTIFIHLPLIAIDKEVRIQIARAVELYINGTSERVVWPGTGYTAGFSHVVPHAEIDGRPPDWIADEHALAIERLADLKQQVMIRFQPAIRN